MTAVTVTNQAELDAALADPDVLSTLRTIEIRSSGDTRLEIRNGRGLTVRAYGHASVHAYDYASVHAEDAELSGRVLPAEGVAT
ncbi:hypothetical protein [Actinomyces gaoshouyii]|uniref:hypothetical protein n=1 Tax=Actinomyces gaoshouyii TaxID=1960083 RepID=UPI0009BD73B9|nr:hypothetical protein [Actinomyces gaoshouyii]ARD42496.1 hypothetical protein B6G06_09210 [Actinomyces gaoshouyii]